MLNYTKVLPLNGGLFEVTFYEISQAILDCVDEETGEIIDFDRLSVLDMERKVKIENIACWYKEKIALADAIKQERDKLNAREQSVLNEANKLKLWLSDLLQGEKLETGRVKISWRRSSPVEITEESQIPIEYIKVTETRTPMIKEIGTAIKNGVKVPGAKLLEKNNIQIK